MQPAEDSDSIQCNAYRMYIESNVRIYGMGNLLDKERVGLYLMTKEDHLYFSLKSERASHMLPCVTTSQCYSLSSV